MSLPQLFIASLEAALNSYIRLDASAAMRLTEMQGRVIRLEILGIDQQVFILPQDDGVMLLGEFDAEADTTLSGTPLAFAKLGLADDTAPILFSGEIRISGDTRLGHQFKKILAAIDIDWEEELAKRVGDLAAHQAGNIFRGMQQWWQRSRTSCELDIGEYLQEESHVLPSLAEVERFVRDVDELREATDRLEARLHRLQKNKHNPEKN